MDKYHKSIGIRAPALYLLPGMILGLATARYINASPLWLLTGAAGLGAAAMSFNRNEAYKYIWLSCFILSTSLAFWAYGHIRFPKSPDAATLSLPAREAALGLEIEHIMQPLTRFGKTSGIARVLEAPPTSRLHPGDRLYFRLKMPTAEPLEIQRGLQLKTTAVLDPIQANADTDHFENYLKDRGIHYRFQRAAHIAVTQSPSRFNAFCHTMNQRFLHDLRLAPPNNTALTNIYVAMLLGRKNELTREQTERFRMSGTMHFFAISGLHIGVIATVIAQFFILLRVPRNFSPWLGLPLLYLYVEITGAAPSAVRAFMMAAFFWASHAITRQRSPIGALAASAVAVLLVAPEQLQSVGFQLSYTVVLSILLFGLPLHEILLQHFRPYQLFPESSWSRLQKNNAWAVDQLFLLFAISASAWLASAPLSAGLFGFITPGSILLNMALVHMASLVIISGVLSLSLATLALPWIAGFINHSAWLTLTLMDALVRLSTTLPASRLHCDAFPSAISYTTVFGFFALLFWLHQDRTRFSSRYILTAPLFVLIMITIGYIGST